MKQISTKRIWIGIIAAVFLVAGVHTALASDYSGKKVLFVDSYHEGYGWSDGITEGIQSALDGTGVELKVVRMDTKRNTDEAFKQAAAQKAKEAIEAFQPDVVIAADDNASKYLIEPFFKEKELPFVFCGVNWDASVYGFPCRNVTGMVEVTPAPQLLEQLRVYAKGDRIGFLGPDILTAKKEAENYRKVFGLELTEYYAKDVEDWKKGFAEMQSKVDMLLIDSDGGLYKDQAADLVAFVEANTKIPTGTSYDFMAPFAFLDFAKVAHEQGSWSAKTALKILDGQAPADIPIAQNTEGQLIVNTRIAKALGLELPYEMLESADRVIE